MRHILALFSVMIPSLLTHTGWQDGKGRSAYDCTCAHKHRNCLPGKKSLLPPTAVPLQWLFRVRTKKFAEHQHPLCKQTCLQAGTGALSENKMIGMIKYQYSLEGAGFAKNVQLH